MDASQTHSLYVANDAYRIEPLVVMPIVALPIIAILLLYVIFAPVKKRSPEEENL